MKKNRYEKAYKSLLRLRHHEIQAARDLYYIHCQLQIEASIVGKTNYFTRFAQLFTIPRVFRCHDRAADGKCSNTAVMCIRKGTDL
jgi:hypothetical protein